METQEQREERIKRLEQARAARNAEAVWPTPDDAGTGVVPIEVAPGRGNLNMVSSSFMPTIPTALAMVGFRTVSFSRLFMSQPWVAAAVMRMLTWAVRVPLKVYRYGGDSGDPHNKIPVAPSEHALAAAVRSPWERSSAIDLVMAMLGPTLVHGNSVVEVQSGANDVLRFQPQDWRFCRPLMPFRDSLEGFTFNIDAPAFRHETSIDEVLYTRWWSPIYPIGCSPLQQLGVTLQIEDAAQRYQRSIFQNGARPFSAITASDQFLGMDRDERKKLLKQLRDDIDRLFAGPENAGRPPILPPGLDWKSLGQTTVEAELIDQRKITREEIAAVYLIPPPLMGILDRATYANIETQRDMTYCLPGDSLVSTDRGPVEVASIQTGDRVWSYDPAGMRLNVVAGCAQTSVDPLVKIRAGNRTLRCTDNHPVLVARRHKGDSRKRRPVRWTHEWVAAGQVKRGDLIVTADGFATDGVTSCPTREDVTEGFMEFCGLLMGDGNVSRNRRGDPAAVLIARAAGARYMDHYREVMRREFVCATPSGGTRTITLNEQVRVTQFSSRQAAEELVELGLSGTAHTKSVPGWIFGLAPNLRAAFLRGFCDADGSVDKKGHLTVYSANNRLLAQVRELFIGLGVPVANLNASRSWVKLPNGKRIFSVMWRFQATDSVTVASVIGSNDPQDQQRLEAGSSRGTRNYRYEGEGNRPPMASGCGLSRVLEVEQGHIAVPVYNLTVEDGHNFVADGVVTHNTDCLGPPLVLAESAINAQVVRGLLHDEEVFVEFDFGAVLRGDRLQEIEAIRAAVASALMSPNEGRGIVGLPRVEDEGMDQFYMPLVNNLAPVGTAPIQLPGQGGPPLDTPGENMPGPRGQSGRRLHVRSRERDYDLAIR